MQDKNNALFRYKDEEFCSFDLSENEILFLSSLDSLSIGEGSDIGNDYSLKKRINVFAENLLVSETFTVPNVRISVCNLKGISGVLDVSGAGGETPTVLPDAGKGADGSMGENAGTAEMYVENISTSSFPLKIVAKGGSGGNGQTGPMCSAGGNGGNGGNGGEIKICSISPFKLYAQSLYDAYNSSLYFNQFEALKAAAVSKEDSVVRLVGSTVDDICSSLNISKSGNTLADAVEFLKKRVRNMQTEAQQKALKSVSDSLKELIHSLFVEDSIWQQGVIKQNCDLSGGSKGTYGRGSVNGKDGENGNSGNGSFSALSSAQEAVLSASASVNPLFPPIHPSQCLMMLQKARITYFMSDVVVNPQGFCDTAVILNRIINRVSAADNQNFINYYETIKSSIAADGYKEDFFQVKREASALLNQLKNGLDFYGYRDNDVPLSSFSFYKTQLDLLLANLDVMEKAYDGYFKNLQDASVAMDSVRSARALAEQVITQCQTKLQLVLQDADTIVSDIDYYQGQMPGKKKAALDKIALVKDQIEKSSGYSIDDLVSALSMCGFAPDSSLIIGSQGVDYLNKSNYTVNTDDGQNLKKEYVVSQIQQCEADFESLKEGYMSLSDGTLEPDDPGANKLLVDQNELTSFLNKFYDQFPSQIKDAENAFQAYVDLVIQRNNKILDYNALVVLMLNLNNTIDSNSLKIDQLDDSALDTMQPDLPKITTFITKLYNDAREQVMKEIYLAARAYRYWALSDENLIATTFGSHAPSKITGEMLRGANATILSAYGAAIEERGRAAQQFPVNTADQGIIYKFPAELLPEYINQLKKSNVIYFIIPTVYKETSKKDNPFAGLADVRMLKVRAWIEGAKTSDGILQVEIVQCGSEELVNKSNTVFSFNHLSISTKFMYYLDTKEIIEDGDVGQAYEDSTYALHSPFAGWRLCVNNDWNKDLDLTDVTNIEIEFWGTNYSFR